VSQLPLDGVAPAAPGSRRLTERQRDLLRFMRLAMIVGVGDVRRFYADPHGALRRLERIGLVAREGQWWTPR
jgi:hypothetical protein